MADVVTLLQGRIMYLEQENAYLKDLLKRWYEIFFTNCSIKEARKNEKVCKIGLRPFLER